ncbi:hypothetical protein [Enterococcus diestrammenae]|uniref:hypothetical protein n=1 Tax=Enterococcus diestrammenae TaxID=1155073 RepID=UPI0022DF14F3|nr:hypothetical protein [Enterococcus diestrammenae]
MGWIIQRVDRCFLKLRLANGVLTLGAVVFILYLVSILPQTIPIQLSPIENQFLGEYRIGNYGNKLGLFFLPALGVSFSLLFPRDWPAKAYGRYSEKSFLLQLLVLLTWGLFWVVCFYYLLVLVQWR